MKKGIVIFAICICAFLSVPGVKKRLKSKRPGKMDW